MRPICVMCKGDHTLQWWKCCDEHIKDEEDVICTKCLNELHPTEIKRRNAFDRFNVETQKGNPNYN